MGHYFLVAAVDDFLRRIGFSSFNCEECGKQKFRRDALKIHNIMRFLKIWSKHFVLYQAGATAKLS